MRSVCITGAAGGIGSALVAEYLDHGDVVFAAARRASERRNLSRLHREYPARLTLIDLDITDSTARLRARQEVLDVVDSLDVLVNAAGVNAAKTADPSAHVRLDDLRADDVLQLFEVNAIAPLLVVQAFLPELSRGGVSHVLNLSSEVGSIERKTTGGNYSYAGSKAALNMLTRALANEVKPLGIVALAVHPGRVRTEIGGFDAELSAAESASKLHELERGLSFQDAGSFRNQEGEELSW